MTRRRKLLIGLAALPLLALAVYLVGPRRVVDTRLPASELPSELSALEGAIAAREGSLSDITSGCQATLVWAGAPRQRTPLSLVYLHGFSATRQETAPLTERLATALGANRFEARLRGHGRGGAPLGAARAEEWLADGAEALEVGRRIGERVVVVAVSTGGSLAAWLLTHGCDERVAALVLISPNFGPRHPAAALMAGPWGAQITRLVAGEERGFQPRNELQARYWTWRYPSRVLVEMQALVELAKASDPARLRVPLLTIRSPGDQVLDPAPMAAFHAAAASEPKLLIDYEESGDPMQHVLAGDVLSPESTEPLGAQILEFLRPLGQPGGRP